MSIRIKLVIAFLVVAGLVPVLGGIAVRRVQSINSNVETLSREAVPNMLRVQELGEIQSQQQAAALSYVSTGNSEDRQRYVDMNTAFAAKLNELSANIDPGDRRSRELIEEIGRQHGNFELAAGNLLAARQTTDRSLLDLRTIELAMTEELQSIRRRYAPTAASAADPSTIPQALRVLVNDVLLGTQGMQDVVAQQMALAAGYALLSDDGFPARIQASGVTFNNWLAIANTAGGPDDKVILARVQEKFFKQYEPAIRAIVQAADQTARSRKGFDEANAGVSEGFYVLTLNQTEALAGASNSAESTAGSTGSLMLWLTLIAFAIATALSLWFAGTITRPILRLRDAADRISTGEVEDVEIDVKSNDEIGQLAQSFQRMLASVRFLMMGNADDDDEYIVRSA